MTRQRFSRPPIIAATVTGLALLGLHHAAMAQPRFLAQASKQEEPAPRQPRAAVPGPNAVPGIPEGEKSKAPDFSVRENMPEHSQAQAAILGQPLHDAQGTKIGEIENLVVDQNGKVLSVIIGIDRLLGLTEERVEIEWRHLRLEIRDKDAAFVTDLSRDELRNMPKARPDQS
ncbi:PRC-barrel domain-containing protein [Ferrovibrio sp.]|uniref:PRC-barrel domain-containing protein n=1 Tax=Ferrovibrio sp. TaxID=1917215 RepID=UPI00261EEBC5|nr:PRC-barrel domain-containing protein [Ferrovibrio sp.]